MKNRDRPEVIQAMINDVLFGEGDRSQHMTIIEEWLEQEYIEGSEE